MASHILERREQPRPLLKAAVEADEVVRGASFEDVSRLQGELAQGAPVLQRLIADGVAGRFPAEEADLEDWKEMLKRLKLRKRWGFEVLGFGVEGCRFRVPASRLFRVQGSGSGSVKVQSLREGSCGQAGHCARNCPTGGKTRKRQEDGDDINMVNETDVDEDNKTEISLDKEDSDAEDVAVQGGGAASFETPGQEVRQVPSGAWSEPGGRASARWSTKICVLWSQRAGSSGRCSYMLLVEPGWQTRAGEAADRGELRRVGKPEDCWAAWRAPAHADGGDPHSGERMEVLLRDGNYVENENAYMVNDLMSEI